MRKQIKKWGNGAGIFLSSKELELYDAKVGDVVDISDLIVIKRQKGGKKK